MQCSGMAQTKLARTPTHLVMTTANRDCARAIKNTSDVWTKDTSIIYVPPTRGWFRWTITQNVWFYIFTINYGATSLKEERQDFLKPFVWALSSGTMNLRTSQNWMQWVAKLSTINAETRDRSRLLVRILHLVGCWTITLSTGQSEILPTSGSSSTKMRDQTLSTAFTSWVVLLLDTSRWWSTINKAKVRNNQ